MDIDQVNNILAADEAAEPETVAAIEAENPQPVDESAQNESSSADDSEGEQETAEPKAAPQTVPLAVHIREREKFKAERLAFERQQQLVNERLSQLFAAQQQAKAEPAPDPDTDPIGYQIYLQKQTAQQLADLQQAQQQERAQRAAMEQQQRAVQYVAEKVNADEAAFVTRAPDYKDAIAYARNLKFSEYTALGMTEEQASQRLQQDAWALSIYAAENGLNAAEYAYTVAQGLGYKPRAAGQGTNSLEMRQRGQKVSVGGGAGGKKTAPTFADLAAMSNEEFAKLTNGDNWQRYAGG